MHRLDARTPPSRASRVSLLPTHSDKNVLTKATDDRRWEVKAPITEEIPNDASQKQQTSPGSPMMGTPTTHSVAIEPEDYEAAPSPVVGRVRR